MEKDDCVGIAGMMPGTKGFTMAAFLAADVPVGTPIYRHPVKWQTGTPPVKDNEYEQFIVAVRRKHDPRKVFVFASNYANNYRDELKDRNGDQYVANGWYAFGHDMSNEFDELFMPELGEGDEVLGWQPLPKWGT